jgi:hypothetical protein
MITDQIGRAMLQFDVVLSAIVTPIETGLVAMGIQVPAVINDVYFNSAILHTTPHGFMIAAMLAAAYFMVSFFLNILTIYVNMFGDLGNIAAAAFGVPAFYYVGISMGVIFQAFAMWYLYTVIMNYMSQSPFFNAMPT